MGRYGPDEFLIVRRAAPVTSSSPPWNGSATDLADLALQFEATERLPLTVSAGICTFPDHGASVTELLATAAATVQEARASGGDAVRIAGLDGQRLPGAATFDVLQGLVFAVDTKDRYTKRHSEDVARYGVFLAGAPRAGARCPRGDPHGGPPPRHRQDRDSGHDPAQARPPHGRRVRGREAARGARRHDRARSAGHRGDAGRVRHHHERWDGRLPRTRCAARTSP